MALVDSEPTYIGSVRKVLGSTVTVALDPKLAGVAPIYRGQLQAIGQIGSLVRLPQGLVDLVATVSLVGISELIGPTPPTNSIQSDERWLQVELLGEINRSTDRFERGVGMYPSIDDPVHFATAEQLRSIFPAPNEQYLCIGRLASSDNVQVSVNADRLVVRHCAIVGSTGSGKTSAVATILQNFISGGWHAANIVVIDPHGEYRAALGDDAAVHSVRAQGPNQLQVPYWALPAEDIFKIFTRSSGGNTVMSRFRELVTDERQEFAQNASWLQLDSSSITSDTPIPFDLRNVWYKLDRKNRETRKKKNDPTSECLVSEGDPSRLIPAEFEPYGPGNHRPEKAPTHGNYQSTPNQLRLALLDPQLGFLCPSEDDQASEDPLIGTVTSWLGADKPISVLDFSGVPSFATDIAVGAVLNLLLEIAIRCTSEGPGIGRPSPVLVVLEEAHRYLGEISHALARDSADRIAREGRKYGIGIALVSQRPTELPRTALAQCGTIIALRLSNSEDQGAVRAALPDEAQGLAALLPSLRTHEAILSGDALVLPTRARLDRPNPWPEAEDPPLRPWRDQPATPDIAPAIALWRGLYESESESD